ncbi:PE family protein [Mycobacterium sp. 050134]|uniref:PE family protein n=1 Tax=Mycobacterium sp. 050134 TaxID=3096111 RepID=UPI002ED89019
MSYLVAAPEALTAAAAKVAAVGSAVSAAHLDAAAPTIGLVPAAADEVSAAVAQAFSQAAQEYHMLAGQAAAFNAQFVQQLTAGANSYAAAEAANAALAQLGNATAPADVSTLTGSLPPQVLTLLSGAANVLTNDATIYGNILTGVGSAWINVANEAGVLSSLVVEKAGQWLQLWTAQLPGRIAGLIPTSLPGL